jgi:single stranded DNA-binding protein
MAGELIVLGEGRLGADAELRKTNNGKLVTSFNLANTPSVNKDGTWVDKETTWVRCFVWGKNATGAANELRKGMLITFSGRLETETYLDKEQIERKQIIVNIDSYGVVPKNVAEPVAPNADVLAKTEDPIDDPWA